MATPSPPGSRLTGGQRWMIVGLLVLQVPWGLFFFPLAAIFAITGIFVPIAMVLMGIGSLPSTYAVRCRDRWRVSGGGAGSVGTPPMAPVGEG